MLDPKFVFENLDRIALAAKQKNMSFDAARFRELFEQRAKAIPATDELRRKRNEGSDAVKKAKSKDEREKLIEEMKQLNQELTSAEAHLKEIESAFEEIQLTVPSIPAAETPVGAGEHENVEIRKVGVVPQFTFPTKDHIELGLKHNLVDFQRGTNVAGSRAYFLAGLGAQLERAVHSLALDLLLSRGYRMLSVPVLVKPEAMRGTGYLPAGRDQAYYVERDDMWLVGTAEVSLCGFHAGEIIEADQLPVKICAHSSCFRREAGAHGKDTKGLYRVHQFQKIEQVIICNPDIEESNRMHAELLQNAEDLLCALELPYRVVQVCTGDLGQGQVKKNDLETWMPSRGAYSETHSCSSFYDFQARRLKIRVRDKQGRVQQAFTLNNTEVATPRILIPLIENHQMADGRIRIPKALQKYMGGLEYIG